MRANLLLFCLLFSFTSLLSQKRDSKEIPTGKSPPVSFAEEVFANFERAIDSIGIQLNSSAREISPNVSNIVIYKLKVKWMLRNDLKVNEVQFLTTYFENKLKVALSRDRRFLIYSGHDLRTLSIKATDSTLEVKNTYTEQQLREYAQIHNIHAVLTPDILVTEDKLVIFLNLNDLNAVTIWSKEFSAFTHRIPPPTYTDDLLAEYGLKKKTGLTSNQFTMSFLSSKIKRNGVNIDNKYFSFIGLGYRFNEVATIFDPVNFFIDSRFFYIPRFTGVGFIFAPGFGFELLSIDKIGRKLVNLNIAAGYYLQPSIFTGAYNVGISLQLSRLLGIEFDVLYLTDSQETNQYYLSGFVFGGHLFINL